MADDRERVILVDRDDAEIGSAGKLQAHVAGSLHRAFSIFVLNSRGELLLQRRARAKYHTGGLWTNTCCGHPRPGEEVAAAAHRRLLEEMGFRCELTRRFGFLYHAQLGGGLSEHEYDHVFLGWFDGVPDPHPDEVDEWRWASLQSVWREVERDPRAFTPWFRPALEGVLRDPLLRAHAPPLPGGARTAI